MQPIKPAITTRKKM